MLRRQLVRRTKELEAEQIGRLKLKLSVKNKEIKALKSRLESQELIKYMKTVIRMAAHWINLWSYLLPADQRESMAIGCNQLLTVAQDFYFQASGWRHISRIQNG